MSLPQYSNRSDIGHLPDGPIAEIFGIPISLILLIPGGLFELALAFWLLIKGFQPEVYARGLQPEAYGGHAEVDHAEMRR
jgi:hypothetical protein